MLDPPDRAAEYGRTRVVNHPTFAGEVEYRAVRLLNTCRVIGGHVFIVTNTPDTLESTPVRCSGLEESMQRVL